MKVDVLTSGYVSMDHIIKIATPAKVGFTSLVTNKSNSKIFYGGCSVNIAYALCRLGMKAMPVLRVGGDYESNGFKKFLEEGNVPQDGITQIAEEATSVCYLLQDNNNDHITIFYPGVECEIIEKLFGLNTITELFKIGKADIIVTTLGKDGSICYVREDGKIRKEEIGICQVEQVVDATGSGDAYMAGFVYGYLHGYSPADCCRLGSVLSYFVLQAEGCCTNAPTEQELLQKFETLR